MVEYDDWEDLDSVQLKKFSLRACGELKEHIRTRYIVKKLATKRDR